MKGNFSMKLIKCLLAGFVIVFFQVTPVCFGSKEISVSEIASFEIGSFKIGSSKLSFFEIVF